MPEKVTDPSKIVTDPVVLESLAKQGIDKDYVEFIQDYGVFVKGKSSPYMKRYRDKISGKEIAVFSQNPMVTALGEKIEARWRYSKGKYYSKANTFSCIVEGKQVKLTVLSDQPDGTKKDAQVIYEPQLFIDGVEILNGSEPTLLPIDPTNQFYNENTLEWTYGQDKRRIRIIEGKFFERWLVNGRGIYEVAHNTSGTLKLKLGSCTRADNDPEQIPVQVIGDREIVDTTNLPDSAFPVEIGATLTVYPDTGTGGTTVDGQVEHWYTSGNGVAWATLRNSGGTAHSDTGLIMRALYIKSDDSGNTDKWRIIMRGIATLLTSALPEILSITGVTFSLYNHDDKIDQLGITPDTKIFLATPANNNDLVNADYAQVGSTPISAALAYGDWGAGYNVFTLIDINTDGFGYIITDGITPLGIKNDNYDASNNPPAWGSNLKSEVIVKAADSGSGYKPKLIVTYTVPPIVTHQATTNKEDTTATGNGNITDIGGENCTKRGIAWSTTSRGDPGSLSPAASAYENYVEETGSFGTGAFTRSLTSLPEGTIIYTRAYAFNSAGYNWSGQLSFLTKPAAPTNVAATDGSETSKVVITWTKSTGATDYHVWRDAVDLGAAGDVATFDDTGADAGVITPGTASASDGTSVDYVTLSLAGESVANGTTHTYKVVASNATGNSDDSTTNTGYRGVGALTYQWQRSAADSDASYSNIAGGTTDPYNDTGAPSNGDGRYFKCVLDATGTSQQTSTADRGYRGWTQDVGVGAIAISGSLGRLIKLSIGAGSIAISGALSSAIKFFQDVGSGSVAISGALTTLLRFTQAVGAGSVAISGTLGRLIKISTGSGAIALSGSLSRLIKISVGAGSVAISSSLGRKIKIAVGAGAIAIAGALNFTLDRILGIKSTLRQDLTIVSTLSTDLTIKSTLSTGLTIESTLKGG